jgi:hypothetical protein
MREFEGDRFGARGEVERAVEGFWRCSADKGMMKSVLNDRFV